MNDLFDLRTDTQEHAKHGESGSATGACEGMEKTHQPGIECRCGGSEHEQRIYSEHLSTPDRTHLVEVGKDHRAQSLRRCELHEVMQETKQMASQIKEPSDLRDLERSLTERRKDIDRKYDTRGSRLKDVLGRLLYENRISEDDLRGLGEEKMKSIRSFAQFLRDNAA